VVAEANAPGQRMPDMTDAERKIRFSKGAWPERKRLWKLAYPESAGRVNKTEKRALEIAKPIGDPSRVESWLEEFRRRLGWLKEVKSNSRTPAKITPAKLKKRLIKAGIAFENATRALDAVPPEYVSPDARNVRDTLKREGQGMRHRGESIRLQHTGNRVNPLKDYAAKFSHDLLDYYIERPTQTTTGPWLSLAALLYEAATGTFITNDQIAKQCQKYLKHLKAALRPRA
jgi:hypothetical protein